MFEVRNVRDIIENNMAEFSAYTLLNRAIPDMRDGMKPVHRRILYTFHKEKATSFTKSATLSGKVMAFHPHGDSYPTMVGMSQKDAQIVPWLEGKGNFGQHTSSELQYGASRYTELKLSEFSKYTFKNLNRNTVKYIPNYDGTTTLPEVIPVKFPTILMYAQEGIGVGMASKIPSFNMKEVAAAIKDYIDNGVKSQLIPDFATGGSIILDGSEMTKINENGKSSFKLRGNYTVNGNTAIINSIPYSTSREIIINKIIDLVRDGKLKEVLRVNDITGLKSMGIEIRFKNGTDIDKAMNKIYSMTTLEDTYSANMNVICNGLPKVMGTWAIIEEWLKWRVGCIKNTVEYETKELEKELVLLKGFSKIINHIDRVIEIIRHSDDGEVAINLMKEFDLDEVQANYILKMELRNINKTYIQKHLNKQEDIENRIKHLNNLLSDDNLIMQQIKEEVVEISDRFGKDRMTQIISKDDVVLISKEETIEDYNCRIVYSGNYIKKHLKQSKAHKMKDGEDIIGDISTTNKSTLLIFTNKANRYRIPVHKLDIKQPSNIGDYIKGIVDMDKDEHIIKIVSVESARGYMLFCYDNGKISKIDIKSYMSNNVKLANCYSTETDMLDMEYIPKDVDVLMVSSEGKCLILNTSCFNSKSTRTSQGNVGMKLQGDLRCVYALIGCSNQEVDIIAKNGKNKLIKLDEQYDDSRTWSAYLSGKNGNQGNFVLNCRSINSEIEEVIIR